MQLAQQQFLADVLVRRGVLDAALLPGLIQSVQERGLPLAELMVAQDVASENQIAQAIAEEWGFAFVPSIDVDAVPLSLAEQIPITYAKQHKLLVIGENETHVQCAVADPLNTTAIDDVRTIFGKPVEIAVAPGQTVLDAINRVWERKEDAGGTLQGDAALEEEQLVDILDSDDDAPIIAWVNSLFSQAVRERASDIHIEPEERDVVVRYRIDGELYIAKRASKQFMAAILARVKIMAQLNIAEKRLPQDGRITLKIAGKNVDVRVSTIPTSRSYERIVMRLLHKTSVLHGLEELGFAAREYALMDELIRRPDGIILVTGPTGSGKTTTLYACLNRINDPSRNILTAEDPVEYEIGGIHQVHVKPGIGLTFANSLRAFLRQDPDVVMVGEIRDRETADIAIQASLTGHLVLSTIHTNDAAGAVTRLVDMGIEPFLVRSSLIGILAQRLVRLLCPACKVPYEPNSYELEQLGLDRTRSEWRDRRQLSSRYQPHGVPYEAPGALLASDPVFFRAKGCNECMDKGFIGRKGIYELLVVDDAVGGHILQNADAQTIKRAALHEGMDSLRDDGARKVIEGLTTVEEVLGATQQDYIEGG
ncbi:MAG: type II secretion system ATPase GspE [Polyangiaceae bacterium]